MRVLSAHFERWLCQDRLIFPLGLLWLSAIVDCLIMELVALRLVSEAPRNRSLGHMTPYLIFTLVIPFHSEALPSSFSHLQALLLASFQHNALSLVYSP